MDAVAIDECYIVEIKTSRFNPLRQLAPHCHVASCGRSALSECFLSFLPDTVAYRICVAPENPPP